MDLMRAERTCDSMYSQNIYENGNSAIYKDPSGF